MPEPTLAGYPAQICEHLDAKGGIVLTQNHDGTVGMAAYGVNHFQTNSMLSLGIHINLTQHDQLVLEGAAGHKAQRIAEELAGGEV